MIETYDSPAEKELTEQALETPFTTILNVLEANGTSLSWTKNKKFSTSFVTYLKFFNFSVRKVHCQMPKLLMRMLQDIGANIC